MDVVASQITSLTFVCSTDYSDADQGKMASNMENVSIWWRHHEAHNAYLSIFMRSWVLCKSLFPGIYGCDFQFVNFNHNLGIDTFGIQLNITMV